MKEKTMSKRGPTHRESSNSAQAILAAALTIAVREGYEGTTMAEVARRSGLPVGSVYWHFKNKEQLFSELIDYCFEQWKLDHLGPSNRALLRRSIAGSAGGSTNPENESEAFWVIALLFALERRLKGNMARERYLEVRKQMFDHMIARIEPQIPPVILEHEPDFGRKMVVMGRALTNGFYIAAAAEDDIDFEEFADLSASAIEALIAQRLRAIEESND